MAGRSYLLDLFAQFGPVSIRRVFGGDGLFSGDVMMGYADDGVVYLKTDEQTRPAYVAEGCASLSYNKRTGEVVELSFYTIPDRLYDDPDELAQWARQAATVAQRAKASKRLVKKAKRVSTGKRRASR